MFNHNHKSYEKKMVIKLVRTLSKLFVHQVDHIGCFDVIIEHLANINLGHDVQMLKPQARLVVDSAAMPSNFISPGSWWWAVGVASTSTLDI